MIFELAFPYVSVVVVALFWLLAMRPVLRLIHASPATGARGLRGAGSVRRARRN